MLSAPQHHTASQTPQPSIAALLLIPQVNVQLPQTLTAQVRDSLLVIFSTLIAKEHQDQRHVVSIV